MAFIAKCPGTSSVQAEAVKWDLDEEYFGTASNVRHSPEAKEPQPLDETFYPSFTPLIRACQAYARLSGCRFSIAAFEGIECDATTRIPVVSSVRAHDSGPLLSAKLRAAPMVNAFAQRLRSQEPTLLEDLTRAFHFVMKETARNSMIATCKAADFFPPSPAPSSVHSQDCHWDEVGLASAPVIAQRLYNDEKHRLLDDEALVRAKTASFVVEFADELGVKLPALPEARTDMLQQFQQDLASWTAADRPLQPFPCESECQPEQTAFLTAYLAVGMVGLAGHAAVRVAQGNMYANASRKAFGTRMRI